ncbi:NmrA family NAD(P)-binding protein [Rhizobium pusense]|uniref:SDR family oxidoreductase n=1 Tax=Agrobacterium pusense TaxID=648995 RepID=UPI001FCD145E|nr:NmrA family NAD(P)-binding protein [Agrobacterium pusense]MCJ2877405.1 NmrA family NAD(P)-binding protein [Agrobacterium pusense]
MTRNHKAIPQDILIFGAAAHIGGPLAQFLTQHAPAIRLRLATSNAERAEKLRATFPAATVVIANYNDLPSLLTACEGVQGVFALTPSGTDEAPAMGNLIRALKEVGEVRHMIRLLGMQPESKLARIPQSLRNHGLGLPIQHPIAKTMLDESDLPVTYLNSGATFMDNFFGMRPGLQRDRCLIWPERLIPYIDPRDIAEVAARLFLSDNHRHIGQFHTMNNGQDILRFSDVAQIMSEVWNEPIAYDGSEARFKHEYAHLGERRLQYLWDFFLYEQENEVVWSRNDFVQSILGRNPVTVREWLVEHTSSMLG